MCPRRAKKLIILSRSEYLIIFTPHRYRRPFTTVSSPSVRGGHTPDTCARRLQPPQHFQTCERLPTQDLAAC